MEKPIEYSFKPEAENFLDTLSKPVIKKFLLAFDKTARRIPGDWFVKMPNTDGLYEFRVEGPNHTYRLFAFWDSSGESETLIVCTHGLDKKTQKTPAREIKKAQSIRKAHFQGGS